MVEVPGWMRNAVGEFAKGIGLPKLAFNDEGVAAVRFENSAQFHLEYAAGGLALSVSVATADGPDAVKLLLSAADPLRRNAFTVRTALLGDPMQAVFAVRLGPEEVTVGNIEKAMAELLRSAENHTGRLGA